MAKAKKALPGDGSWGNGSVVQRGDKWRIRWRENGKQREMKLASKAEAVDRLREIQARLQLGQPGLAPQPLALVETPSHDQTGSPGDVPIANLVAEWTEYRRKYDVRTADAEVSRWNLHLAPALETTTLQAITPRWVMDLGGELVRPTPGSKAPDGTAKQPISGPTAHRVISLLSAFFRWAIGEGHVEVNPAAMALTNRDLKRLLAAKSVDAEVKAPLRSWAEVDALFSKLSGSVAVWYLLQARCGLRPGEATAQRWDDVDLDGAKLTVRGSVRHGHYGPTKGGKAREVPLTPKVVKALRAWRKVCPGDLACPSSVPGSYLGVKAQTTAMTAAFAAANIEPRTPYEAGRVTYGTLVGGSGQVSAFTLQKWMGHADVKTTERYVKAQPGLSKGELAALGG